MSQNDPVKPDIVKNTVMTNDPKSLVPPTIPDRSMVSSAAIATAAVATASSSAVEDVALHPVPYLWALFTILMAIGIYMTLEQSSYLADIGANWSERRCEPQMMLLASLFGHDINENFQFCLQQIIQEQTKGVTGPFAQGMGGFTSVLMNLMNSANSFRTMLATLVGGVIKIVSEFKARMTALMGRVKMTASRMKAMMFRIYGTMFAVIYMGLSAQTGIANFGDTFIFKFIDTFCFPPEQPIMLEGSMDQIPIAGVKVGDILKGGHRVESIYRFAADGQTMVQLKGVLVSSNHFIQLNSRWVMAKDHPDAETAESWSGGSTRPLVCLTTHDHIIPIDGYIFADYDETEEGNAVTQAKVADSLNGKQSIHTYESYEVGSPSDTKVLTIKGPIALKDIRLGDMITNKSKVVGIQISSTNEFVRLGNDRVASGSLVWSSEREEWVRAHDLGPKVVGLNSVETIALFVSPGAIYELQGGSIIRDAMEIYSPDTKSAYADALLKARLD